MTDEEELYQSLIGKFGDEKVFLIQIGANDGIMADPVNKFIKNNINVSALLIEPQKEIFKILQKNYSDVLDRVSFLNYAIAKSNSKIKLYRNIDPLGSHGHSTLLLRQNEYAGHFDKNSYELVDGIQVSTLLKKIDKHINILVIDTEGYDIEIIKQFISNKTFPDVIFFEKPYPSPGNDRLNIVETGNQVLETIICNLNELDYDIKILSGNVLCIKKYDFT
jgi:FkbM family methyltransferase